MKTWRLLSVGVVVLGLSTAAFAQRGMRRGMGNYNPSTEVTVTGTVDEVRQIPAAGRGGGGLHLVVGTEKGPMTVHLGPAAFVSSKNFNVAKGDALTVTGSKVTMAGEEVVLAREIRKGEQLLTLREPNGAPLWSGRGRTP
jgi:DNA/RNA endonuclease YhcR with UshA esterase domain